MARIPQPSNSKGSLKWIQVAVNDRPDLLEAAIVARLPLRRPIEWLSPLRNDEFAEYRDHSFLERLGLQTTKLRVPLSRFWPSRGPQWDALGRAADGALLIVEAKANIPELLSPASQASPQGARLIKRALLKTQTALKARPGCDWTQHFYQYANRLAHLHYLWQLNGLDAHLVFLYFVGAVDVGGPSSEKEWRAGIEVLHEALGIRGRLPSQRVVDVFLDVAAFDAPIARA